MMPEGPETLRRQARSAFKAGDYADSALLFQQTIDAEAPDYTLSDQARQDRIDLGVSLFRCSKYVEAARAFEAAITIDPNYAVAHHKLGLTSMRLGRVQRALEAFRAASSLAPDDAAFQWSYAEVALALGRQDEGEAAVQATLALDPTHPEARAVRSSGEGRATGVAASDTSADYAGLMEAVRSRKEQGAPPRRQPAAPGTLFAVSAGALAFMGAYLYVRTVLIGG